MQSVLDQMIVKALTNSILATARLDAKGTKQSTPIAAHSRVKPVASRESRGYTQLERIGNFTTYLRREIPFIIQTSDSAALKYWCKRICHTNSWLDVAVPDINAYFGWQTRVYDFTLNDGKVIMNGAKMKSLCELATEEAHAIMRAEDHGMVVKSSNVFHLSDETINQDNFASRLQLLISSANAKVAAANEINNKSIPVMNELNAIANSLNEG